MPNWITNKIEAPKHVIEAMLNPEGRIDFSTMAPFPGPNDWDSIALAAEEAAEIVCGIPVDSQPLIAALQTGNRSRFDIKNLSDESFKQFVGMVENYRACGYLHSMDFNRKVWGTKWNACEPQHDAEAGVAQFDTAWSCPEPVLTILSKRFPPGGRRTGRCWAHWRGCAQGPGRWPPRRHGRCGLGAALRCGC